MSTWARNQMTVPLAAMSSRFSGRSTRATGHRDHHVRRAGARGPESPGFGLPEGRLAVAGEELGHGGAGLRLDFGVGIEVVPPELPGGELSHGGLARPHHADQQDPSGH